MRGQLKSGVKLAAVVLATATIGLAQTSMPAPAPYGPGTAGYGAAVQQQHRQGVPGTINYVEGQATLNGQQLGQNAAGYAIAQPNEPIDTQAGYVEVLLTPGAFLRVGHNSEVVLQSAGLANMQLQLVKGQAMIEADDLVKGTNMQINMDGATTTIDKSGLYDFNANDQTVRVLDGKAKVLDESRVKTLDKHDQLVLNSPKLKVTNFNEKAAKEDPLYVWSEARSEAESQANVALAQNINVYGGWYGPGWYWDPFWADYAFLPGNGLLWGPFGWGFFSPGFAYAAPYYGFYGGGFYGHGWHGHGFVGGVHRGGIAAGVRGFHGAVGSGFHGGFAGGGFHGGGFAGGGFHGGGRR
jgi:hypothetical protein